VIYCPRRPKSHQAAWALLEFHPFAAESSAGRRNAFPDRHVIEMGQTKCYACPRFTNLHSSGIAMKATFSTIVVFCLLLVFAGCGSSDSNSTPAIPGTLTGYYTGTLKSADQSTTYTFEGVVLPNQQMYGMYGTKNDAGYLTIKGMLAGTAISSFGTWVVNSLTEYGTDAKPMAGRTLSGTYDASNVKASITTPGGNMQLAATAIPNFTMTQPASIATLDGEWNGVSLWGDSRLFGNFFVVSNGQFDGGYSSTVNGAYTEDCLYTAKLEAQSQNYFTISTTLHAGTRASCTEAGQTVQGVTATALMSNGKQHMAIFVTTGANQASVFIGDKN
jgi:hypothetical protein